jgi:hypothetical protein
MTARIFAMVPAVVLALGAATALAQPAAHPFAQFDRAKMLDRSAPLRPYDQASAAAMQGPYIGDGSDPSYLRMQQELLTEPGYSVGTGAAQISKAAAKLGDGSNGSYRRDQGELPLEPGYSVGTGAARVSSF